MIIEHFEDNKNSDVNYDEEKGFFTIKGNRILGIFNIGNTYIYEKNTNVLEINKLKEKADKTTLTDYDIGVLYDFAKLEFGFGGSKDEFVVANIGDVFKGLNDDKLMIHKLIEMAYNYKNAAKKGEKYIIEKFTIGNKIEFNKNYLLLIIFIFIILCLLICYVYYK